MNIDNSAAEAFRFCPAFWYEKYVRKIQLKVLRPGGKEFGTRFHQVLQAYYSKKNTPECTWTEIEPEVQAMFAAYKAHWKEEPFTVVDVEKRMEIGLGPRVPCECEVWVVPTDFRGEPHPGYDEAAFYATHLTRQFDLKCPKCHGEGVRPKHTYVFRCDLICLEEETQRVFILDTKTERRNSMANVPRAWAARDQATLYLWGLSEYLKKIRPNAGVGGLVLNICTRGSEKGRFEPTFRRETIFRTEAQIKKATNDLVETADIMEEMLKRHPEGDVPQWRQNCTDRTTGWPCDFYELHVVGESESLMKQRFQEADDYLGEKKAAKLS